LGVLEGTLQVSWVSPLDLYRWVDGDPDHVRELQDTGPVPWLAHPELKLAYWRPLSSALTVLDHQLFGLSSLGYTLHSILWYGLLSVVLALLLRRVLPGSPLVALALLVWVLAASHRQAVCWIAARNALVTACFGLAGLLAHIQWREGGRRGYLFLSLAALLAALLAGEAALGAFALLLAYELCGAPGGAGRRIRAALPAVTLAVAWLLVYVSLGYGTHGSGAYINPLNEPLTYLSVLPGRLLAMTGCLFLGMPADLWFYMPELRWAAVLVGALATALLLWLVPPAWSGLGRDRRRAFRWLTLGAIGSLLPQASGMLGPRSLVLPSVGAALIVALVLQHWWTELRKRSGVGPRLRGALCVFLAIVHLVAAPYSWFFWSGFFERTGAAVRAALEPADLDRESLADQNAVLLTAPDVFVGFYTPFWRQLHRHPMPQSWWVLSSARCDHRVHRVATDTIELELLDGRMLETAFEILFRNPSLAFEPGDEVHLEGLDVRVLATDDVGPTRVEFRFDRSLDDPSLHLLAWEDGRLVPVQLPSVGETMDLPLVTAP